MHTYISPDHVLWEKWLEGSLREALGEGRPICDAGHIDLFAVDAVHLCDWVNGGMFKLRKESGVRTTQEEMGGDGGGGGGSEDAGMRRLTSL